MRATLVSLFAVALLLSHATAEPLARGERGAVATVHPLATAAALDALRRGGNAVDAAVAAALTLGVVDGSNSGIGGGCFLLLRTAGGEFIAIDGRETAPAAATCEMFLREGKGDTALSQTGALAVGVPGALAAYDLAVSKHGKLGLKSHLLAAAELAERGFPIGKIMALRLRSNAAALAQFPSSRAVFSKPDGSEWKQGDTLRQPELAATCRAIAEHGSAWFYDGPFAEGTDAWMRENGGRLTREDFRGYRAKVREPIRSTYRGHELVSFPPPSSGGVHVAQILNVAERFDLAKMGHGSADAIHIVTEAMKLAFADRAHWLGDPDFAPVPRGLVAKEYAERLASQIRMDAALQVRGPGAPHRAADDLFGKHTTHFSAADAEGNWVACTATLNTAFGSKVVVPGTGVLLNNEMDDFSIEPGVPNAFGLVGGAANAVAPGKRPLSSMSPTIVLRDGEPILALGAAGGPTIISQTLLAIIATVDFHLDVRAALAAPRFHHQWKPDELKIERGITPDVLEALRNRGHTLAEVDNFGLAQAVARDGETRQFSAAADPRGEGTAAAW